VRVHLHAFEHPTRAEPARDIVMRLSEGTIEEMRELPRGREVGAVLLEPEQVGAFYGSDREQRELVRLDDVPQHLVDAILSVEDRRFESHMGIDPRRIAGALLANMRAGGIAQGGSTLTQQLVKNFFLTPERTLRRKATEAVMALLVEARYDKPAILEAYLNEIYLGRRGSTAVHGVGEASHFLFGKKAADLTVAEAAMIAAIIQSPNRLSPHRNPDDAVERRNLVLQLMRDQGRIDDATLAAAQAEPLGVARIAVDAGDARYFLDLLRRQLPEVYDAQMLEAEGLRIYSTLDLRLQRAAARALGEGLEALERDYPGIRSDDPEQRLQGCVLAMRPQTGEILALVGGRDYGISQFDRCAQARRQTGSVFKPFVYAAALEPRGGGPLITLASFLEDEPLEVDTPAGPWRPENFDKEFHGRVSVREAIERSMNVAAARLGQDIGIERVARMARRLGVTSDLPAVPSLALGTAELSPLEVARAYATIANGGQRPWPHAFEDVVAPGVGTLDRRELRFERVLDPGTAFLTTELMRGVVERGTGRRVRAMGMEGEIAGKTGTTDDERDLWFVGFTPELVAVVWIGFDQPRPVGISSSRAAIPIWVDFMSEAVGKRVRGVFPRPREIESFAIDPRSGALAAASCPRSRREYFLAGTEPHDICTWGGIRRAGDERAGRRRGLFDWLRGR
jgi:penicillin-binding protein 1B